MLLKTAAICLVCLVAVEAFNLQKLTQGVGSFLKSKEAKKLEKSIASRVEGVIEKSKGKVQVEGDNCASAAGCCVIVNLDKVNIHTKACLNLTYHAKEKNFDVELKMNDRTIIDEKGTREIDVCRKIKGPASACVAISDLKETKKEIVGKAQLQVRVLGIKVTDYNLGPIRVPLDDERAKEDISRIMNQVYP